MDKQQNDGANILETLLCEQSGYGLKPTRRLSLLRHLLSNLVVAPESFLN